MSITTTVTVTESERARLRDRGRVLLVMNEVNASAYGATLEREGFTVFSAVGGAAALVALRRKRPHVVIVDAELKGISTDELTRMLNAQVKDGTSFVLVGTEGATLERRETSIITGAFDYFQIPIEFSLLVLRLKQLITLKHTFDRLRAEADRDYLTGLANRRRFRAALGQELERWRRYQVSCALLIIDIDYLKQINDNHGHSAGDTAIRHVAHTLTKLSRDNDTAARLGGEEFALLLASTDSEKASRVAERLRSIVAAEPVNGVGMVTVSLGVAACPSHATTERALYAASDAALYTAKREGRNRAVVASNPLGESQMAAT